MFRSPLLALTLLSMLLTTACAEDASDMLREAEKAQSKADAKIDDATEAADQHIRTAQAEADVAIAAQNAEFKALREKYRHQTTLNLVELDQKIADLEARAMKANGQKKAEIEARLEAIRAHRAAFMTDYEALETHSAATWDTTKARLDAGWAELAARVDGA